MTRTSGEMLRASEPALGPSQSSERHAPESEGMSPFERANTIPKSNRGKVKPSLSSRFVLGMTVSIYPSGFGLHDLTAIFHHHFGNGFS